MTAAFELTRPEHAGKYQITLYQQGWRLGGKGASGRGPADRIEEHGLHLWFGFYENAFRLVRECYEELARNPERCRIAGWQDAFKPDPFCGVMERSASGTWSPWIVQFPPVPGLPGDRDGSPARWTVADYLQRAIALVRALLETIRAGVEDEAARVAPRTSSSVGAAPGQLAQTMERLMRYGGLTGLAGLIQGLDVLDEVARLLPRFPSDAILSFHAALADSARAEIERMTDRDQGLGRLWEVMDVVLATIRGIIRHRLVIDPKGFDAIDHFECREWLTLNGASERSVQGSFLRAHYDLAFAYEDGDVTRPRMAAGQAVRAALRAFFTYRGSFFWKMQAGMGDVVFAPFYEVLERRGVKFEFFHRLRNLGLRSSRSDGPHIATLDFDVQAKVRTQKYEPLVDVRGLPCWPAQPDWRQLADGERLRREGRRFESHWDSRNSGTKVLHVGRDFDLVVLAVGLGAVPYVCREIIARDKRWQRMVSKVQSVPTQALQLWLSKDVHQLGWKGPSLNISCYVEPFDTWADMPQLVAEEHFPRPVRAVAYFCSVLGDAPAEEIRRPDYPETRRKEVRQNAIEYLQRDVSALWPRAIDGRGRFRWNLLVSPEASASGKADESRIDSQYWTANVEPSDRYCLSLPDSSRFRISPLDRTYDNLTVAGDWTSCGFNEGCVEAAVMSGRLAAHALSQSPPLEEIVGFDHP